MADQLLNGFVELGRIVCTIEYLSGSVAVAGKSEMVGQWWNGERCAVGLAEVFSVTMLKLADDL